MCVSFSLQTSSQTFSLNEQLSETRSNMCIGLHVKYPLFLSDFNETRIFWTYFRRKKNTQMSILMKIRRVGTELFHANGRAGAQTDMTKLIVALRNTVLPPQSERLRTRTTWNPNEKFEQILSRNPNAALESERPARCSCMFVRTFLQHSATHTLCHSVRCRKL